MHVQPIRVVLADDHPTFRKGIRAILDPELTISVVAQAGSFRELMDLLTHTAADVVLLDLLGMGPPPVTAVSTLVRAYPQVAIIIFSSSLTGALELLEVGAGGYLAKEDLEDDVITAIHTVMTGQRFLSPTVTDYLDRAGLMQKSNRFAPRELEVLQLITEGLGTKAIAERLGIAGQTVSNYIYTLYRKTGCTERTQLVDWYRRIGREDG
jgi:DNA-binding NarL/FixJ family response regulator